MPKIQTPTEPEKITIPARSSFNYLPWIIVAIVILAAAAFFYHQKQQANSLQKQIMDLKQNPQKASQEESKVLLDKIGQLIELPDGQPTIATVTDLTPLKDQPFFARAEVGDKVLIYSAAKRAILYRPSTNKIIEVAPVNLDNPPANVNTNAATNTKATTNTNTSTNSNTSASTNTKATTKATTNTSTK